MSGKIWISNLKSNYELGDKLGLRTKFFDEEWEPASFILPIMSDAMSANMKRSGQGFALHRGELPEAAAVWNEKSFVKTGEIFWAGGFLVVKSKLADILSRFDLGEGGLVPFPIYKSDLVTPMEGEYFLLNFGARKNTILPEQSTNVERFSVVKATGLQTWKVNSWHEDDDVLLSSAALEGPDLWFESIIYSKIFMSGRLASALQEAGLADDWRLKQCRILETGQ